MARPAGVPRFYVNVRGELVEISLTSRAALIERLRTIGALAPFVDDVVDAAGTRPIRVADDLMGRLLLALNEWRTDGARGATRRIPSDIARLRDRLEVSVGQPLRRLPLDREP